MKTQVTRLRHLLALLEPAVPGKPTLDALRYVRLGEGKAVATDLDVAVSVELPEADEVVLLPLAPVRDFLRYTPGSLGLTVMCREGKVILLSQAGTASFDTLDPEEYPPLPAMAEDGVLSAEVDGDDLVKALTALVGYTSRDDDRPVLTAVCLTLGEPMEAAAADGFRLAVRTLRSDFPGGDGRQALVPAKAVKTLERLWKLAPSAPEGAGDLPIAELVVSRRPMRLDCEAAGGLLQFRFGEVAVSVRPVQGTFPNYHQLIPTEHTSRVTTHAQELERAVRQVQGVASQGSGVVRLQWEGDHLTLSAQAEEVGKVEVALGAHVEAPGRVAFNVGYLLDYLKGKEGPVSLSIAGDSAPGVFTHQGISVVIMPMFVQWDEEAQPSQEETEEPAAEAETAPQEPKPRKRGRRKKQEK